MYDGKILLVTVVLWKHHIDIRGMSFQTIWMRRNIGMSPTEVFSWKLKHVLRTFGACSYAVKLLLFISYFGSLCTKSIWCKSLKKPYYEMLVATIMFVIIFGYHNLSSPSTMCVELTISFSRHIFVIGISILQSQQKVTQVSGLTNFIGTRKIWQWF